MSIDDPKRNGESAQVLENTVHHQFLTGFEVKRGTRQLFWDDAGVAAASDLRKVVHQPRVIPESPAITGFRSGGRDYGFRTMLCSIVPVPGGERYRMYYMVQPGAGRERWRLNGRQVPCAVDRGQNLETVLFVACAESDDGVHWEEPDLGQMEFEGSRDNNLIDKHDAEADFISQDEIVFYDERDSDPARRYKLYNWARRSPDEMYLLVSPDGLVFTPYAGNPVWSEGAFDSHVNPIWDEEKGLYLSFGRAFGRATGVRTSRDLVNWSDPEPAIRFVNKRKQDYTTSVHRYAGMYIGFVNTFYLEWRGSMATLDITLASSRDGFTWSMVDENQPFVARSPEGQHIRTPVGMLRFGDDILFYYSASPYWHGPVANVSHDDIMASWGIRVATLKTDRFVSWTGDDNAGYLSTMPFGLPEGDLYINTESTQGYVEVRVLDQHGRSLAGMNEPVRLTVDSTREKVVLPMDRLSALAGETVQLRFDLRCARLFSYWFE